MIHLFVVLGHKEIPMSKKVLALLLCLFLFLVETPLVFAQETVTVSQPANLRANANRSSQIIQVLNPGDQITILESVSGNTVWLNGAESNVWYRVQLNDGTIGFVWSGLVRDTAEVVNT